MKIFHEMSNLRIREKWSHVLKFSAANPESLLSLEMQFSSSFDYFLFFFWIFNFCWYWHKFKIISKRYFLLISSFEMSLMTWNLLLILHSLSMFLFEFHKNNVNSYKTHFSWQGLQLIETSKSSPYLFFQ